MATLCPESRQCGATPDAVCTRPKHAWPSAPSTKGHARRRAERAACRRLRPGPRVLEMDDRIAGWLSFHPFVARCAYRGTSEVSVCADEDFRRRGVARALLTEGVARSPALGLTALIGLISVTMPPVFCFSSSTDSNGGACCRGLRASMNLSAMWSSSDATLPRDDSINHRVVLSESGASFELGHCREAS